MAQSVTRALSRTSPTEQ